MTTSEFKPLVSIVLPCRNEQGYIQACLQSALDQDPPEGGLEILVADGMSTDGTREYLQQMATQYPSIRILDNPGRIVSAVKSSFAWMLTRYMRPIMCSSAWRS